MATKFDKEAAAMAKHCAKKRGHLLFRHTNSNVRQALDLWLNNNPGARTEAEIAKGFAQVLASLPEADVTAHCDANKRALHPDAHPGGILPVSDEKWARAGQ